ncbi:MAG: 3D domain-containing protein [Butyricicoccus sp.]
MQFMSFKSMMRCLPAAALCAALCVSHVSAYNGSAKALGNLPASDTSSAAIGMISTAANTAVGSVRTTEEMSQAKAEVEAKKAAEEAARKAAEEAARKAAEEAARKAALKYTPTYGRTVTRSSAYSITETIEVNGKAMGNFKLTFYCACSSCSGGFGSNTATGVRCTEGRTIAVDPRVIPLGSKVYIEGFGDFIAEDTGGAIKGNRIDIYLNDHSRCYALGVARANVYVMS